MKQLIKSATVYKADFGMDATALHNKLADHYFQECAPTQLRSVCFLPPGETCSMAPDLFPETVPAPAQRARPRVLMHVCDAGQVHHGKRDDLGKPLCQMRCKKCGTETDWLIFETVTAAKRGIHCPNCNKDTR